MGVLGIHAYLTDASLKSCYVSFSQSEKSWLVCSILCNIDIHHVLYNALSLTIFMRWGWARTPKNSCLLVNYFLFTSNWNWINISSLWLMHVTRFYSIIWNIIEIGHGKVKAIIINWISCNWREKWFNSCGYGRGHNFLSIQIEMLNNMGAFRNEQNFYNRVYLQ